MTKYNIGVISLGCNKNRVDTEEFLAELVNKGHELTQTPEEADIIIVNTCGFIDAAKMESIEAIIEAGGYKKKGVSKVLVTGCLSERYRESLAEELPEVDGFIGVNQYGDICNIIERVMNGEKVMHFGSVHKPDKGRVLTTPQHLAYVRVADGCDNRCSYCIIPYIRGKYVSRSIDEIYYECANLVDSGVKELVVVAQDTAYYGKDIYGQPSLSKLLRRLSKTGADWIRVLYTYPERVDIELLETMADTDNIVNYLDIPLQHVDDDILKSMGRPCTEDSIRRLLFAIDEIGDFTVRTTFIAGYPGETEEQHRKLCTFVGEGHFDRMGAFAYSQEESTRAARMDGQLDDDTKLARQAELMRVQRGISVRRNREKIDNIETVLIESYSEENQALIGRTQADAPVTDGMVLVHNCPEGKIGEFVPCKITDSSQYDLIGDYYDISQ